jgi:hypothetical protein
VSTSEPVAAAGAVFISYSRRDYYFAESLSYHLDAAGFTTWIDTRRLSAGANWAEQIDTALDAASCVVVVISPDGVASPAVRVEYQRALARGTRVILAVFRTASIPDDLHQAERVDLRGRFAAGVRRLAAAVTNRQPAQTSIRSLRRFVHPPWVAAMGLVVAGVWTGYPVLGSARSGFLAGQAWDFQVAAAVLYGLILYYVCIAFLRRRMSLTRLAVILGVSTFGFGYPVLQHTGDARIPRIYPEPVVQLAARQLALMTTLTGLALGGLFVVVVIRPGDLLRWSPTGRAWPSYRRRHVPAAATDTVSATNPVDTASSVPEVRVVSDAVDAPAAEALRAGFNRATTSGDDAPHLALLVTGRTRVTWVREQLAARPASLVTFVASGIDPAGEVSELWRRQWVDARHWWPIERPRDFYPSVAASRSGLPPLPEELARSVLPGPVKLACHVALSIAAVVFVLAASGEPDGEQPLTVVEAARMVAFGAGAIVALGWVGIAHGLLVRRDPAPVFSRHVRRGGAAAIASAIASVPFYAANVQPWVLRAVIALTAVVVLFAALVWLQRRLTWWFPAPVETDGQLLAPTGRWRHTAVLLFLHLMAWTVVLQISSES